jgi:hypothetical protein
MKRAQFKVLSFRWAFASRILPLFIFVGSSAAAFYSFQIVKAREEGKLVLDESISLGKREFSLYYQGQCLGVTSTEFKAEGQSHVLLGHGELWFRQNGRSLFPSIRFEVGFTELDQLGASVLELLLEDTRLTFGTTGIDPIQFKSRLKGKFGEELFEFLAPGPIFLVRQRNRKFGIRYPELAKVNALAKANPMLTEGIKSIPFQWKEITSETARCVRGDESLPDLSGLFTSITAGLRALDGRLSIKGFL